MIARCRPLAKPRTTSSLAYPNQVLVKHANAAFWPGANFRLRCEADFLRLSGEPAALPRPKYFLKFHTRSHHICPSIPIRARIGARSFGMVGLAVPVARLLSHRTDSRYQKCCVSKGTRPRALASGTSVCLSTIKVVKRFTMATSIPLNRLTTRAASMADHSIAALIDSSEPHVAPPRTGCTHSSTAIASPFLRRCC